MINNQKENIAIAMAISDLIEEFLSDSDQGESETESEVDEESQTDLIEDCVEVDQKNHF